MGKDHELLEASRTGNISLVEKLISTKPSKSSTLAASFGIRVGVNVNCQDQRGYTPLHHAALNGHCDIVKLLLQSHASVGIADDNGSKPLHLAAWNGKNNIVLVLLLTGPDFANVNDQNKDKETPLHCAAQHGHVESVKALLDNNADPNIRNIRYESPLDLASQYGRLEVVRMLLTFHPKLLSSSPERFTPIHLASRNGHRGVVELLLVHGADINRVGANGTALHEASLFGKIEVVSLLLKRGINARTIDSSGRTALELVAQLDTQISREIAQLIIARMHEGEDYETIATVEIQSSMKQRSKGAKIPLIPKKYLDKLKQDCQIFDEFNETADIFGPGHAKINRNISRSFGEADLIPGSQQRGRSASPTSASTFKKYPHFIPDTPRSVGRFRAGLLRRSSSARSSRSLPRLAPSASYHSNRNTHSFYSFSRKREKENSFHETSIRQHHPSIDMFPVTPTKIQTKKRSSVSLPSSPQLMSLPHSPVSRGRGEDVPIHDTPLRPDDDVFFPITPRPSITFETFLPQASTKPDQKVFIPLKPPADDATKMQMTSSSASPSSAHATSSTVHSKLSIFVQPSPPPLPKKSTSSEKSQAILEERAENDQEITTSGSDDEHLFLDTAKRKDSSASGISMLSDVSSSRSPGAPIKPARSKLPTPSSPPPLPPKPAHMMTESKKHRPPSPKTFPPVDEDLSDESGSSSNEGNTSTRKKEDVKKEKKKFIIESQEDASDVPPSSGLTPPFPSSLYNEITHPAAASSTCSEDVSLDVAPVKATPSPSSVPPLSPFTDKSQLSSTPATLRSPSPPFSPPSPNTAMQQVSSTLQKAMSLEKITPPDQSTKELEENIIRKAATKILQSENTELINEKKEGTTTVKSKFKNNASFTATRGTVIKVIVTQSGQLESTEDLESSCPRVPDIVPLTPNTSQALEDCLNRSLEPVDEMVRIASSIGNTTDNSFLDVLSSNEKVIMKIQAPEEDGYTDRSPSSRTDNLFETFSKSIKYKNNTVPSSQSAVLERQTMPTKNDLAINREKACVLVGGGTEKSFIDSNVKDNVTDSITPAKLEEKRSVTPIQGIPDIISKEMQPLPNKESLSNCEKSQTQAKAACGKDYAIQIVKVPTVPKQDDQNAINKDLFETDKQYLNVHIDKSCTKPVAKPRKTDGVRCVMEAKEPPVEEQNNPQITQINTKDIAKVSVTNIRKEETKQEEENNPKHEEKNIEAKGPAVLKERDSKPMNEDIPELSIGISGTEIVPINKSPTETLEKVTISECECKVQGQVSPVTKNPDSQRKIDVSDMTGMNRRLSLPLKAKYEPSPKIPQCGQSRPQSGLEFKSTEVKRARICSTRSLAEHAVTSHWYSDYDNVGFSVMSQSCSDFKPCNPSSVVCKMDESSQTWFPVRRKTDAYTQTFPPKLKPKPAIYPSNSLDTKSAKAVKKKTSVPTIAHKNDQSSRSGGKLFRSYPVLPNKPKKYSCVTNKENVKSTSRKDETQESKREKAFTESSSEEAKNHDTSGRSEALSSLDGNKLHAAKLDAISVLSLSTVEDWDDELSDRTDEAELPRDVKRYRGLIRGSSLAYRTRLTSCGTRDPNYDSDEFQYDYHIDRKTTFSRVNASLQADDEIDFPDGKHNIVVTQQAKVPKGGLYTTSSISPDANDAYRENLMENECCDLLTRNSLTQKPPLTKKYSSGEPGEKRRKEDELNRKNLLLHHHRNTVTLQSGFLNHALVTPNHSRDSSYDNNNNNNNTGESSERNKSDDQKSASKAATTNASMTSAPLLPSPMSDGLPDFTTIVETVTAVRKKGSSHESTSGVSSSSSSKSSTLAKQDSGCATLDENDEWAQIANVMKSFGSGLNKGSVYAQEFEETFWKIMTGSELPRTVESWLSDLSISQYSKVLCGNGFDDINFLASDILEEQDLIDMNIANESHRRRMLDSAKNLPKIRTLESLETEPSATDGRRMPTSVGDWLRSLCLGDLEETFLMMGFITMDKAKRIKDHEIAALIHLRGHRKRVRASLGSSKSSSANKTRSLSQSSSKTTSSRRRSSPPLPRSPLLDKINFFKDYTQTTTVASSTVKSNASVPSSGSYSTGTVSSESSALTNYSSLSDQVVPATTIEECQETTEFKSHHHRNHPSSISEAPTLQHRGRYTSHDSNYPTSPDFSNRSVGEEHEEQDLLSIAITRLTESNEKNQPEIKNENKGNMTTSSDKNEIRVPDARRASYLSTTGGELVLRAPNETTAEVEVSSWCHTPEILIKSCCNYQAYYLGSMLVQDVKGVESTVEACAKMKKSTDSMKKIPTVTLSISYKGVKFIDAKSKHEIAEHEIHNISFASQDADDLSTLAYITRDARTDHHYCHVFRVTSLDVAYEIILTLGQAFEVAYQLILKEQALQDGSS